MLKTRMLTEALGQWQWPKSTEDTYPQEVKSVSGKASVLVEN